MSEFKKAKQKLGKEWSLGKSKRDMNVIKSLYEEINGHKKELTLANEEARIKNIKDNEQKYTSKQLIEKAKHKLYKRTTMAQIREKRPMKIAELEKSLAEKKMLPQSLILGKTIKYLGKQIEKLKRAK